MYCLALCVFVTHHEKGRFANHGVEVRRVCDECLSLQKLQEDMGATQIKNFEALYGV
jgi:hypothetical protein